MGCCKCYSCDGVNFIYRMDRQSGYFVLSIAFYGLVCSGVKVGWHGRAPGHGDGVQTRVADTAPTHARARTRHSRHGLRSHRSQTTKHRVLFR